MHGYRCTFLKTCYYELQYAREYLKKLSQKYGGDRQDRKEWMQKDVDLVSSNVEMVNDDEREVMLRPDDTI